MFPVGGKCSVSKIKHKELALGLLYLQGAGAYLRLQNIIIICQ